MLAAGRGALLLDALPTFLDLLALPRPLVLAVFARLPVDTRLRCSEVNRAWRALLAETSLWICLDLSTSSGLIEPCSEPLLRAAVAKAGGQLRALDITGRFQDFELDDNRLLLELLAANATTLTELRVNSGRFWSSQRVRAVLEAAPALSLFESSVSMDQDGEDAHAILRNEPPFQAVRVRRLLVNEFLSETTVAMSSALRCHASIDELSFIMTALNTSDAMCAVVEACITLRLHTLRLHNCRVTPATLPELTRLVAAGALRELIVDNCGVEMFDEAHETTGLFVAAVRMSAMTTLQFFRLGVLPENVAELQR